MANKKNYTNAQKHLHIQVPAAVPAVSLVGTWGFSLNGYTAGPRCIHGSDCNTGPRSLCKFNSLGAGRNTSIHLSTSMFQLFGVYCLSFGQLPHAEALLNMDGLRLTVPPTWMLN